MSDGSYCHEATSNVCPAGIADGHKLERWLPDSSHANPGKSRKSLMPRADEADRLTDTTLRQKLKARGKEPFRMGKIGAIEGVDRGE